MSLEKKSNWGNLDSAVVWDPVSERGGPGVYGRGVDAAETVDDEGGDSGVGPRPVHVAHRRASTVTLQYKHCGTDSQI